MFDTEIALQQQVPRRVGAVDKMLAEQRRLIGRELHDNLGQQLTGLGMLARRVQDALPNNDSEIGPAVEHLVDGLRTALSDIRSLSHSLVDDAADSDDARLSELLEQVAQRTRFQTTADCRFRQVGNVQLTNPRAIRNLCRIAQEGIQNALRHGSPSSVEVVLRREGDEICMEVHDDGVGLPSGRVTGGVGLKNMWRRAREIGATLNIRSRAGAGTTVACSINEGVA
ncbi:MAG: sensor histidine kinase [Thermoanaerobaculales bacterium]|jgi:signal transduction histidine kinase|nr:sensor histidine kinase [Thermoanaerobaculales bacterium]